MKSLDAESKFQALSYILADANYSDLNEIHLLPLDDGTFTSFTSSSGKLFFYYLFFLVPSGILLIFFLPKGFIFLYVKFQRFEILELIQF